MDFAMKRDRRAKVPLGVRISAELNGELERIAALEDRTKSYLAEKAIAAYVEAYFSENREGQESRSSSTSSGSSRDSGPSISSRLMSSGRDG